MRQRVPPSPPVGELQLGPATKKSVQSRRVRKAAKYNVPAVRTLEKWIHPTSGLETASLWTGVELIASTYFIAECFYELDGFATSTAFIATSVEVAESYIREHQSDPDLVATRMLVRFGERTYTAGAKRLEELAEVQRCKANGALRYFLTTGEVVWAGREPATDATSIQRFETIFPRPPRRPKRRALLWPPATK